MAYTETTQPGAASAKGKADLPKGAVCTGVSITPSQNGGFTVEHRYRQKDKSTSKGPSAYAYIEPRDYTFESLDTMLQHIEDTFGEESDEKESRG